MWILVEEKNSEMQFVTFKTIVDMGLLQMLEILF